MLIIQEDFDFLFFDELLTSSVGYFNANITTTALFVSQGHKGIPLNRIFETCLFVCTCGIKVNVYI